MLLTAADKVQEDTAAAAEEDTNKAATEANAADTGEDISKVSAHEHLPLEVVHVLI